MSRFSFSDRFLPNQDYLKQCFNGTTGEWEERIYRLLDAFGDKLDLKISLPEGFTLEGMSSASVQMDFLKFIIRMNGYKRVLEIGSFVGFSAMHLSSALPDDGEMITIEKYDLFFNSAKENFRNNGFEDRIKILHGNGLEVLKSFDKSRKFDMIFLDAHKEMYREYLPLAKDLLNRDKGVIIVDDVLYLGDVLNDELTQDKGKGVMEFLNCMKDSEEYWCHLLPIGNGMMMLKCK